MEPQPSRYSVDTDLSKILEEAGGTEDKAEETPIDESAIEKLSSENARLGNDATKVFPESPWYLAFLMVALVGVLAGILFLIR